MQKQNAPAWLNDAVFYEIYPQSFCDSNGDGIGDIAGIISKLDYIKELGCNAIWLNPCFTSPFYDAGYDISDYYTVAPRYGTNEDLAHLFREVHARDMHILLDLVPGHTSVKHPWFEASMKAEKNEYSDRYVWTNDVWDEPQGLNCIRGISERDGSCVVNFFSHQPALNYGFYEPDPQKPWQMSQYDQAPQETLAELKSIMRFWLKMGCDGFRVDMAGSLVKNDPDSTGTIALWQDIRKFLDCEFPHAAMISEWGDPDRSLAGGFHMDFLLHFGPSHYNDLFRTEEPFFCARGKGDISAFAERYLESYEKTERRGLICIPSGNHDMFRLARKVNGENGKIAFAFLLSMPGAPFIYYGDEIGMRYIEGLASIEGGYCRTGSRSPMQWDDTKNAGFSTADADKLYIRMDEQDDRPTVKAQIAQSDSLYHEIKRLIAIRKAHPALQNTAEIEFLYAKKDTYPLVYLRKCKKESILVILNPSGNEVSFPCSYTWKETVYQLGGGTKCENGTVTVAPTCAAFYRIE